MLAIGMAGTVITIALMPLSRGDWTTYAVFAASSMTSSVAFPNAAALLSGAVAEDRQGQIMGLNNAAGAFARVAGPLAASLVFAGLTVEGPFIMGAAIVTPAIFLALSAGRAAARAIPDQATTGLPP
jgi:predicted MFS family arabinose efflux permease